MQRAAVALADDIADLAIGAIGDGSASILVVADNQAIADVDTLRLLTAQLDELIERVQLVAPADEPEPAPADGQPVELNCFGPSLLALPLIKAAMQLVPSGIGLVTKLLAHQYNASGTKADTANAALHTNVAGKLLAKRPELEVTLDPFRPTPASNLLLRIRRLESSAATGLAVALETAAVDVAATAAWVTQCNAALEAARARALKLVEALDNTDSPAASPLVTLLQLDLATEARLAQRPPGPGSGGADSRRSAAKGGP